MDWLKELWNKPVPKKALIIPAVAVGLAIISVIVRIVLGA